MVSTMTTRNAGRRTAATRGGGTSEHDGREGGQGSQGGGRDGQESDQGSQGSSRGNRANGGGGGVPDFATLIAQQLQNLLPTIVAQVGNHVNNQWNNRNQDDNVINDNNQGNVRTMNNGLGGCSYKEFMACNPKDYDGKGCAIVYTRWIEKIKSVQNISGCEEKKKVKYIVGSFIVGASHAVYTDRFHELARLVPHLVTPENKRIGRYIYGLSPQIHAMVAATESTTIQSAVLKAGMLTNEAIRNGALKKARGRDFVMGAKEARQDPNIVTGTFTLNNHYATTLFNSSADYSFVSTTFIPLLDIEASNLGFSYEIERARGQLVEINNVIRGFKLEIEGYIFDIDLIPVLGEKPEEKVRHSKSAKVKEHKLKDIVVVRNFPESPYRLVPSEMEELSSQLREL
ncbi:hypothetical protein Tco_1328475 [Tanacetum coccineum]